MKKILLKGMLFSLLALGFASCSSDDDDIPWVEPEFKTTGVYILNSGKGGGNDANLGYYDITSTTYTKNVFFNQNNGLSIGDIGNDMIIYGSKMYILATGTNKIYITDLKGKLLQYSDGSNAIIDPKNESDQPESPRNATAYNGKVYVSFKTGYVASIDTTSMLIDKRVKVGSYPEQMTAVNNKLYVTNSGYGYDNTVSIVNLNSFTEEKKIEVVLNPTSIISDKNGTIYVASLGKTWGGSNVLSSLQKIDPITGAVTNLGTDIGTVMQLSKNEDKLFLIKQEYDATYKPINTLQYYDLKKNILVEESFITPPANMDPSLAYSLSVDPISGDIYIGTSDFGSTGDMYIFSEDGTYKNSFDTDGINPMGAYFITQVKK